MTIRFSPARNRNTLIKTVTTGAGETALIEAANDDGCAQQDETLPVEALRHFAVHGLCAAERARDLALDARRNGEEDEFERWLAVCRLFDRRMAARVVSQRTAIPG